VNDRGLVQCLREIGAAEPTLHRQPITKPTEQAGEKTEGEDANPFQAEESEGEPSPFEVEQPAEGEPAAEAEEPAAEAMPEAEAPGDNPFRGF